MWSGGSLEADGRTTGINDLDNVDGLDDVNDRRIRILGWAVFFLFQVCLLVLVM